MHSDSSTVFKRILNRFSALATASVLLGLVSGSAAHATTIDFESTPLDTYTSLTFGIATLTYLGGEGNFDITVPDVPPGPPISGHSLLASRDDRGADPFQITFSSAITSFTIGSGDLGVDEDHVHLIAFDAMGNVVDTASYVNPAGTSGGSYLTVSGADIRSVQFYEDSASFPGSIYWDNISFQEAGAGGGTVPEPQSLALLALGALGFAASRRKSGKCLPR